MFAGLLLLLFLCDVGQKWFLIFSEICFFCSPTFLLLSPSLSLSLAPPPPSYSVWIQSQDSLLLGDFAREGSFSRSAIRGPRAGPGRVAPSVRASSPYTTFVGSIPRQGTYKSYQWCFDKWNHKIGICLSVCLSLCV